MTLRSRRFNRLPFLSLLFAVCWCCCVLVLLYAGAVLAVFGCWLLGTCRGSCSSLMLSSIAWQGRTKGRERTGWSLLRTSVTGRCDGCDLFDRLITSTNERTSSYRITAQFLAPGIIYTHSCIQHLDQPTSLLCNTATYEVCMYSTY